MKIEFKDGSFLSVAPQDNGELSITLCGLKSRKELTMSTSSLTKEQVFEMIKFMTDWIESSINK